MAHHHHRRRHHVRRTVGSQVARQTLRYWTSWFLVTLAAFLIAAMLKSYGMTRARSRPELHRHAFTEDHLARCYSFPGFTTRRHYSGYVACPDHIKSPTWLELEGLRLAALAMPIPRFQDLHMEICGWQCAPGASISASWLFQ